MFIIIQIVGIFIINAYSPTLNISNNQTLNTTSLASTDLPFGLEDESASNPISIILTFLLAFFIISILLKYKLKLVLRTWFLIVTIIAIGITINGFLLNISNQNITWAIALSTGIIFGFLKVFKPNKYIHNFTEIFIYPGIATILVTTIYNPNKPGLNIILMLILLVLISTYDIWGVWKSKLMTKIAKYEMEEVKIFGGLIIPYISKKDKLKIKKLKKKYKEKRIPNIAIQKKKIKVSAAILGGGDIAFTIVTMGVFMWTFPQQVLFGIHGLIPALFILLGSILGLSYIFFFGDPKKPYPAMPYITTGIFTMLLIWKMIFF